MKNPKIMLYRKNKLGNNLIMLFLVFNSYYAITLINNLEINSKIFFETIFVILISLLMFLCAIKMSIYKKNWIYVSFAVGLINFIKIFFLPSYIDLNNKIKLVISLLLTSLCAIIAAIITYNKCIQRDKQIKMRGQL